MPECSSMSLPYRKVELVNVKSFGRFQATGSGTDICQVTCLETSGSETYSQEQGITRAAIAGVTSGSIPATSNGFFTKANSEYVFFMIPQDLTDATARVTFKKRKAFLKEDGTVDHYGDYSTVVLSTPLSKGGMSWLPGKYYTYKKKATVYGGGEKIAMPPLTPENFDGQTLYFTSESDESASLGTIDLTGIEYVEFSWLQDYKTNGKNVTAELWIETIERKPEPHQTEPLHSTRIDGGSYSVGGVKTMSLLPMYLNWYGNTSSQQHQYNDTGPIRPAGMSGLFLLNMKRCATGLSVSVWT